MRKQKKPPPPPEPTWQDLAFDYFLQEHGILLAQGDFEALELIIKKNFPFFISQPLFKTYES